MGITQSKAQQKEERKREDEEKNDRIQVLKDANEDLLKDCDILKERIKNMEKFIDSIGDSISDIRYKF